MESPISEIQKWMESMTGQTVLIKKEEDGDLDQVHLRLDKLTVGRQQSDDPDGYVLPQALLFHGQGTINNGESLPQNVYEIPLSNSWLSEEQGNLLHIKTERAVYTIQPF
ncbi:hypothetical protein [Ammoniphilus resinae]|uniref:Uncharacterized protein n=1 Tax=Ammoniphilus resinae TaxID=861532 RepID=A0ABS4GK00_9BACL|nr:hypothetical protein [Ammoniphilus resinae]MBP1930585.1 hypothetical protein [Ammoniphilus resinae]